MDDLGKILDEADRLVVQGQLREAGLLLAEIEIKSFPRSQLSRAAGLFRRVGQYELGLRLLKPIVRSKARLLVPANPAEIAEYAICLQRNGSIEEAASLLDKLQESELPEVLLYRAIFHFPDWEYELAIPHLERLLNMTPPNSYLHIVGRLNLAAAFVTVGRYADATPVLDSVLLDTAASGFNLLHCNALEVAAQSAIFTADLQLARKLLDRAERMLSGVKTFEKLWLIKWNAIIEFISSGNVRCLAPAREEASRKNHWETLREIDFFECKFAYRRDLAMKLYFGTPSGAYRNRIAQHIEIPQVEAVTISGNFEYSGQKAGALCLLGGLSGQLRTGFLPNVLLATLLSDAYKGFRVGQLFSRLFPGQYFNPYTAGDRVHQIVKRLKSELEEQLPGAKVTLDNGFYRINLSDSHIPIEIPKFWPRLTSTGLRLCALESELGQTSFSSKDVQKAFQLSKAAANRLIQSWREEKMIEEDFALSRTKVFKTRRAA